MPTPEEQADALVERITQAWFKLTEFGASPPMEPETLATLSEGRAALAAALEELVELAPGRFSHGGSRVLSSTLDRLADTQPRALAYLLAEALGALTQGRRPGD